MRVLLVALNAKYVHTNLALRYLREEVRAAFSDVSLREFSINDHLARIAGEIYEAKADVIGFSCYIWNLKEIVAVIRHLHPVCPNVRFVIGGPEVSFEAEEFLREHPEVDALVVGEGEKTFLELLTTWQNGRDLSHVAGIAWTENGITVVNPPRLAAPDLNNLPLPYTEKEDFTGRLVYVETTRGCPFNCQYCLSSTFKGVRFLEPERFRTMFRHLLENGARTVKFVDRTFNANKHHALEILNIVREESEFLPEAQRMRVHCEMAGDLLDAEWLDYFENYPRGLIQLEIGVQSTHQPTLKIVSRPQNFEEWKKYVPKIKSFGIPLHLDLIAGLPEESWLNFRTSFNAVYLVKPDMLQLGFLKVLKGSGLRLQSNSNALVFTPDPPYTILETPVLSHGEILQLQRMEDLLDKYYNSGKFAHSLCEVLKFFSTPFDFYHEFAEYWQQRGWFQRQWPGKALFEKLWEFIEEFLDVRGSKSDARSSKLYESKASSNQASCIESCASSITDWEELRDALRFDYYLWERPNSVPDWLEVSLETEGKADQWKTQQDTIRRDGYWENVIPKFKVMDRRQWYRNTAVAYFTSDVLKAGGFNRPSWYLFHYQQGNTEAYKYQGNAPEGGYTLSEES
ncbi:MAG: B12-binding domain-containing radical SAM protein [Desulfosporosinus sp.]|nr:B12-binding domain-containing radical SAM protein [Desulfosporosinus sp.]